LSASVLMSTMHAACSFRSCKEFYGHLLLNNT